VPGLALGDDLRCPPRDHLDQFLGEREGQRYGSAAIGRRRGHSPALLRARLWSHRIHAGFLPTILAAAAPKPATDPAAQVESLTVATISLTARRSGVFGPRLVRFGFVTAALLVIAVASIPVFALPLWVLAVSLSRSPEDRREA
jgi:hypothetical protein